MNLSTITMLLLACLAICKPAYAKNGDMEGSNLRSKNRSLMKQSLFNDKELTTVFTLQFETTDDDMPDEELTELANMFKEAYNKLMSTDYHDIHGRHVNSVIVDGAPPVPKNGDGGTRRLSYVRNLKMHVHGDCYGCSNSDGFSDSDDLSGGRRNLRKRGVSVPSLSTVQDTYAKMAMGLPNIVSVAFVREEKED